MKTKRHTFRRNRGSARNWPNWTRRIATAQRHAFERAIRQAEKAATSK